MFTFCYKDINTLAYYCMTACVQGFCKIWHPWSHIFLHVSDCFWWQIRIMDIVVCDRIKDVCLQTQVWQKDQVVNEDVAVAARAGNALAIAHLGYWDQDFWQCLKVVVSLFNNLDEFFNWPFTADFLYIRLFISVDIVHMFHIKVCWWLNSNRGPLVSEATALSTESQPLPVIFASSH